MYYLASIINFILPCRFFYFLAVLLLFSQIVYSQKKIYTTKRTFEPPIIDGLLNDEAWETVEWGTDFTQRQPADGEQPAEQTAFKILYDLKNLYIFIRAYDKEPGEIVQRMSRRDGFEGDWVEVNIDSYFDHRTAFSFTTSASGVIGDEAISNNGDNWDQSWDPVWYVKTSIDEEGWTAEMRIPLSQLRFPDKKTQVWGFQVSRRNFRKEEMSNWQYISRSAPGWVHLFGELHGITDIKPQKQFELLPYVTGRMEKFEKEEGNPFATGSKSNAAIGLDGKIGLTSDITLDFTVNPDFGQVEADPSQVNLSAYELFFREQRPFFIEGRNILDNPVTNSVAGGSFTRDNLFYSRRIGRPPRFDPDVPESDYIDQPENTSILGAFKITGKTRKGLAFGILESITGKETAQIDHFGERTRQTVEPLTSYFVSRVQKDYNKGNTIVGGMFTATNRNIEEAHLEFLHKSAYSGSVDFTHNWKDRKYFFSGNMMISQVNGTEDAIEQTQQSQLRFFQRPDAHHVSVDPTLTSLSGTGGTIKAGKSGGGNIRFETGVTWRSPGFELNDIGYLRSADLVSQWAWAGYQMLKPFAIFRNFFFNVNEYQTWDFGGRNIYNAYNTNFRTQFKNFWTIGAGITPVLNSVSNADLRGGPAMTYPGGLGNWYFITTDNRKKLAFSFEHNNYWGWENFSRDESLWFNISYRPVNALEVTANPNYNISRNVLQYVTTESFQDIPRYINGTIMQKTISLSFRVNYIIRPNLSVQYYGQPFASKGTYSDFKVVMNGSAKNFQNRFHTFQPGQVQYAASENSYLIDENNDGITDYSYDNPDFNFVQFRSNMVIRWEYIPGSTLFLVWSQSRTGNPEIDKFSVNRVSEGILDVKAHNIFLIKYTYRFML